MKLFKSRMKRLRDFRDDRGNITIIFALTSIPMFMCLGAAVDYANVAKEATALRAAADGALMALVASDKFNAAKMTGSSGTQAIADAQKVARNYIAANYTPPAGSSGSLTPTISVANGALRLQMSYTVKAPLVGTLGFGPSTIDIDISAGQSKTTPVELAIVVDTHTTYSRNTLSFSDLQSSAITFVKKLYNDTAVSDSPNIRLALVPYSGAVRLDTAASDFDLGWIDTAGNNPLSRLNFTDTSWHNYMAWTQLKPTIASERKWNGCVESRAGSGAVSDDPPISSTSQFIPYFAPDEPYYNGWNSSYAWFKNDYVNWSPISYVPAYNAEYWTYGTPPANITTTTLYNSNLLRSLTENQAKYSVSNSLPSQSDQPKSTGAWFNCSFAKAVPLTYDRASVEAGINSMLEIGDAHVIPEGLAWAWRMLSPTEPFTKVAKGPSQAATTISAYGDKTWQKTIVLIVRDNNNVGLNGTESCSGSDACSYTGYGKDPRPNNPNRTTYSAYGYGGKSAMSTEGFYKRFGTTLSSDSLAVGPWNAKIDDNMMTVCTNIKNAGIQLYVVVYGATDGTFRSKMQACATNADYYKLAMNKGELDTVLAAIAASFSKKSVALAK